MTNTQPPCRIPSSRGPQTMNLSSRIYYHDQLKKKKPQQEKRDQEARVQIGISTPSHKSEASQYHLSVARDA